MEIGAAHDGNGRIFQMDAKRSILIVSFLHLIHKKRSKGRWKGRTIFFDRPEGGAEK
jgi:hypothetical protein